MGRRVLIALCCFVSALVITSAIAIGTRDHSQGHAQPRAAPYAPWISALPRVIGLDSLDSLSDGQRQLLASVRDDSGSDNVQSGIRFPADADLVVYRLDDGDVLVAPANPEIVVGSAIVCVGGTASLQRVALSGGDVIEDLELSVAAGVTAYHFAPGATR